MKTKIVRFNLFLILLGFVFLAASAIVYSYAKGNDAIGIPMTATITDVYYVRQSDGDKTHKATVKYIINDIEIETNMPYYSSSMKEGKQIEILVNPDNKFSVLMGTSDLWVVYVFLAFFGVISIFAGSKHPVVVEYKKEKYDEDNNDLIKYFK